MSSKWCNKCKRIVTTNTIPKYCAWCGNSLVREAILPEFKTMEERNRLIMRLIRSSIPKPVSRQLNLFTDTRYGTVGR